MARYSRPRMRRVLREARKFLIRIRAEIDCAFRLYRLNGDRDALLGRMQGLWREGMGHFREVLKCLLGFLRWR